MRYSMAKSSCVFLVVCFAWAFLPCLAGYFTTRQSSAREGTICKTIDIRNKIESFHQLENCTVIEGFLSILLIDGATPEQYKSLHFPDLVEITDYLLLYRVYGLTTLSNIFPNLSVIRGQKLFFNFALVAFEMMDLEELGLTGLTVIERGAVRLEKNPMLCYIDTIDWTRIAVHVDPKDHFFKENKIASECIDICPANCVETQKSDFENNRMIKRCWSMEHCQRNLDCPCSPGFCINNTIRCCHENCIGGCSGDSYSDCDACKHVLFTDQTGESRCTKTCFSGTYMYKNRRCLLDYECVAKRKKLLKDPALGPDYAGMCVSECPAGFTKSNVDPNKCLKCKDSCPKGCSGKKVDSVQAAQDLSGCTKIEGALEIRIIKGTNLQQELEENLGQITEIRDYLWIHNSHTLLSLSFFKNLRTIGGNDGPNGYAVLVDNNENLQTLFPAEVEKNLEIKHGNMSFHFNRKLCLSVIKKFEKSVKMGKNVQNDIGNTTNGDQAACSVSTLNLTVFQVTGHVAFLRWDRYKKGDKRTLISYVIKYKEAPFKNVSIFDGRDACSNDVWKTRDVLNNIKKDIDNMTSLLVQLKPWTQYVVFIKTYTTSNTQFGARSKLVYFRTAASMPSVPSNLKVKGVNPGELYVTWEPPYQPNGNVTHYEVYWRRREFDPRFYASRDYCNNPSVEIGTRPEDEEKKREEERLKEEASRNNQCETSKEELEMKARERSMEIEFENYLHNSVYLKRYSVGQPNRRPDRQKKPKSSKSRGNKTRLARRRNKREYFPEIIDPREFEKYRQKRQSTDTVTYNATDTNSNGLNNVNVTDDTKTEEKNPKKSGHTTLKAVVYAREIIIPNLGHFEDYNIEVIACQERDPRDPEKVKFCSNRALTVGRTLKSETANNLNPATIIAEPQQNKTGFVTIKWKDPPNPNGPIVKYMIEYEKGGLSQDPNKLCRTYQEYRKINGTIIPNLLPGNYSYRIQTHSLAGPGEWSVVKSFFITAKPEPPWASSTIIAVIVSTVIFLIVLTVIIVWFIARSRMTKIPENFLSVTVNPDYMPDYDAYEPDEWEVDRDKISLLRELGQGSFGMVWEGKAKDIVEKGKVVLVAVKTVNENADHYQKVAFLKEASIMKGFKCYHVVQLLGIVSQSQPALVVMELMTNGDLKTYLRMRRPDNEEGLSPPTLKQIWQMAGEIADGMAYLSDKKFVHRDLAARNCMVAYDLTVKIGDFGMTRDVYETDYYRKGGKGLLPVRWMGPESLKDGVFTSYSDVWSYGVVLWEMVTLAELPYIGLSHEQVIKYVIGGKVIEKPEGCPDRLYQLMCQCWRYKDKQRPTFQQIIEILVPELDPTFMEKSYFFSEENHMDDYHESDYHDDDFPDDHDLLDDSQKPFIAGAEGDSSHHGSHHSHSHHSSHGYEDQDEEFKFVDYNNHDRYGTEPCDCIMLEETDHRNRNHVDSSYRNSSCSNPNSAIDTSDGSKDSSTSKSSNSSYPPLNGINLNIVNGHVPIHMRTTPC